jgi:hypothetical protein
MRPALKTSLAALGMCLAVSGHVYAASDGVSRYRLLFAPNDTSPLMEGKAGKINRAAISRMARVLPFWSDQKKVRFIFVGDRASLCAAETACTPDQRLWERVRSAVATISAAAGHQKSRMPFALIGQAFDDEFNPALTRAPPPDGTSSIDLFAIVDGLGGGPGGCPWRVLIADPDLPPVIADHDRPALPVPPDRATEVGQTARLEIEAITRTAILPIAVWENARGEMRLASSQLLAGQPLPLPPGKIHLHMFGPRRGDPEFDRFVASLGQEYGVPSVRPRFLAGANRHDGERGLEDNPRWLRPGEIEPAAKPAYCHFAFEPMVP